MNTEMTLSQMAAELERRKEAKQDFVADTRQLEMLESGEVRMQAGDDTQLVLPANDIAHNQIATRLDIPTKYYRRMQEAAPQLLADNVNHWFQSKPETRMVRTLDGSMRAFLSNAYQRIENEQIAETVLPVLLEQDGVKIESCAITESRMYIKAVFQRIQGEVNVGDVVQSGVVISNSEVGMGAVKIEPLVYRLVCKNGMIINDAKYAARHVGARVSAQENVYELLTDETIMADDHAILLKVRDVTRAAFDQERFDRHLQLMRDATQDKLLGDPAEAIKVLGKKTSLSDGEQGGVLRHLIEGGDISRWGVLNAVTRTAQDVSSYDRATELESLGGKILTLPASEWKVIAEAA